MSEKAKEWYPVECEHGFDLCPECDPGIRPDSALDDEGHLAGEGGSRPPLTADAIREAGISCGTCPHHQFDEERDVDYCDHEDMWGIAVHDLFHCAFHPAFNKED